MNKHPPASHLVSVSQYTEDITVRELRARGQEWLNNRTCDLEALLRVYRAQGLPRAGLTERQLQKLYLAGGECVKPELTL